MDTSKLSKFAQFARRILNGQIGAKLESIVAESSVARREHPEAMRKLETAIAKDGKDQVVEQVAYTWFNRFSALRFMDVNDLNPVRVVSPIIGQFQPEILAEAKASNIDENRVPDKVREQVRSLLDGRTPSSDAQTEAYRLLIVASCNAWHNAMPFLFERIDDFTELLLPDDLLSNSSILAYMREAMTPDVCEDVEIIGWLYQFYISEKKDEVFVGLKKNKKITEENIPAATQLFTPHWIVRYLVENSLGRLWLLNRPLSGLAGKMDYYIAPEKPETNFIQITRPEEIKVCDPACGSGHMLTYAFDLLYAIYDEEGYDQAEIPTLILTHNLYGIEIDQRAGALAAFALTMKAAARRKRFLRNPVHPNVCVMENVLFREDELPSYIRAIGEDLFTQGLHETLQQFGAGKTLGSLIVPKLNDVSSVQTEIVGKDLQGELFLRDIHNRVQAVLRMSEALSPKYNVVVANPPYMGGKSMDAVLSNFAQEKYPASRFDLFAMFMERALTLSMHRGHVGMINMQGWMFASSLEELRVKLLSRSTIATMAHLGSRGFDTISGDVVSTTAFTLLCDELPDFQGTFLRLVDGRSESEKASMARAAISLGKNKFVFSTKDITKIPGQPIAYWLSDAMTSAFKRGEPVAASIGLKAGLSTGDNTIFQRQWHEVDLSSFEFPAYGGQLPVDRSKKWFPCHSGGPYRKWFGNHEVVVNWENDGHSVRTFGASQGRVRSAIRNESYYFREGITWSKISSGRFDARYRPKGFLFDDTGRSGFGITRELEIACLGMFCSTVANELLSVLCPGMSFTSTELGKLPFDPAKAMSANQGVLALIEIARSDWDANETSWDFTSLPLLQSYHRVEKLDGSYNALRTHWQGMTDEMQRLEEENNRIFIDAYGLQDELMPEVPVEEITLTCNPAYSIKGDKTDAKREAVLRSRTMKEFLHYAVGCMFGRYSLDAPGLILANAGDTLAQYLAKVPMPTFEPDADNVIPILDGDWFADDITERFHKFLRVTFGKEHFSENLAFIEEALGKDVRGYFLRDFYNDHVKRYKKRPIYWLFSSPKGSFNALIYMHRYRPDTVSVVLNDYLREYRNKLEAHRKAQEVQSINPEATPAQRTKALKDVAEANKVIEELESYERDALYPLAMEKKEIDLDEGVKANYPKFGAALKPIKGLSDVKDRA